MDEHTKWKIADGDDTYALEWEIDSDSVVWEIGGFEGRWAQQIADRYNPHITIFEPSDFGYGRCSVRFFENKKVDVKHYGLWVMSATLPLYNPGNDGASLLMPHTRSELRDFRDIYLELGGRKVDLCLMNVEGAEFALLPYMIGNGLMEKIDAFWCQFHRFVPNADERYDQICEGMLRTHRVKWDFYPTAVAWEKR